MLTKFREVLQIGGNVEGVFETCVILKRRRPMLEIKG